MSFDILNYLDRLTPTKGKNRYYCPVCGNNNFTIDPKSSPAKYKCWNGCVTKEIRDIIAPLPEKSPQPKQEKTWGYYDRENPVIQVVRKDDGSGSKRIFQKYWHGGVWRSASEVPEVVKQQAKQSVLPYYYHEAVKHDRIFWVEGEKCADILQSLGLAAVTTIGGCNGFDCYGDYSRLFDGKEIVICPDQDKPGLKYAESIATLYPEAKWLYAFPTDYRWDKSPDEGGLDVADWIAQGATKEKSLAEIDDRKTGIQELEGSENLESVDPAEKLRSGVEAWITESDPIQKALLQRELNHQGFSLKILESIAAEILQEKRGDQFELEALDGPEFLSVEDEEEQFLTPGLIPAFGSAMLSGQPSANKSIFSLQMAHAVTNGKPFLNFPASLPGKVLVLATDQPARVTRAYMSKIAPAEEWENVVVVSPDSRILTRSISTYFSRSTLSCNHIPLRNRAFDHQKSLEPLPQTSLPAHLDRLIDQPFESDASLQVNRWLSYLAAEEVA